MIDIGSAPTWRTEAPSTKVSRLSSGIGWPAAIAAVRLAAPAGSTASTAVPGWCSASQARQPASRPPPPTGITTRSGACSSCSTISRITVPWPAITSGWSKAGTWNLPEAIASLCASSADSSYVSPATRRSTSDPPSARIRSRFCRGVVRGT